MYYSACTHGYVPTARDSMARRKIEMRKEERGEREGERKKVCE